MHSGVTAQHGSSLICTRHDGLPTVTPLTVSVQALGEYTATALTLLHLQYIADTTYVMRIDRLCTSGLSMKTRRQLGKYVSSVLSVGFHAKLHVNAYRLHSQRLLFFSHQGVHQLGGEGVISVT